MIMRLGTVQGEDVHCFLLNFNFLEERGAMGSD